MNIRGIDGLSLDDLQSEIDNGGRFVVYTWTLSVLIMTFRNPTDIFFVRGGESRVAKGLPYSLSTLLLGWWGIPWGPIYSLMSLGSNLTGGKDVTQEVQRSLIGAERERIAKAKARAAFKAQKAGAAEG